MCIYLQLIKISWRQTANLLRTTANVVITHAVVYALVTTGICMYSCRKVWYAILYGCRHIKYSSHAILIPYSINILHTQITIPSSWPASCLTTRMGVICSVTTDQCDQIVTRSVVSYAASPCYLNLVGNHGHYVHQWSNDKVTENRRDHRFMGGIRLCFLSVLPQMCSCKH